VMGALPVGGSGPVHGNRVFSRGHGRGGGRGTPARRATASSCRGVATWTTDKWLKLPGFAEECNRLLFSPARCRGASAVVLHRHRLFLSPGGATASSQARQGLGPA